MRPHPRVLNSVLGVRKNASKVQFQQQTNAEDVISYGRYVLRIFMPKIRKLLLVLEKIKSSQFNPYIMQETRVPKIYVNFCCIYEPLSHASNLFQRHRF